MDSNSTLYRIYVPRKQSIVVCRTRDFTVLTPDGNKLPLMPSLLHHISQQRELDEVQQKEKEAYDKEEALQQCFYVAGSHSVILKSKVHDKRIPVCFDDARRIPDWAEAINREFDALISRGTWEYVDRRPNMYVLSYNWNFRIKESPGEYVDILHKARCCLRGDRQRPYLDFDPYEVYAPVARHETIRLLLAKVAAQNLILDPGALEGADVSNEYLYVIWMNLSSWGNRPTQVVQSEHQEKLVKS